MRKLFRFKYEPCNGTCYGYCKALPEELRRLTETGRQDLVSLMVRAHEHLCDNPDFSFGVDRDEDMGIFVSHFRTPDQTEVFADFMFADCVKEVCEKVLEAAIPKVKGACSYGNSGEEDLASEILRLCTDVAFKELQSKPCPCQEGAA